MVVGRPPDRTLDLGSDPQPGQVGCLLVARLPLACELADRPELWHRPVVVAHPDAAVVWSASPAARAAGVDEGQRLSEAVGRCPTLVVLDARPTRYDAVDEAMLAALEQVTPRVEPDGLGVAYVDLAGLGRAHPSPEALHRALLGCAPPELRPRLGVGPTTFVALLAASQARPGPDGVRVVPPGEVEGFMAPLPVDLLPVPVEVVRRLRLVDVTTLGELARLPRGALVAQFGPEGTRLAGLLAGRGEPVRPRARPERLREGMSLPDPLADRRAVLAVCDQVLDRALTRLRETHRVTRQLVVRAETEQGRRWESTVTLREPRSDHETVWTAVEPVLDRADLPGPVSALSVELRELRPSRGWQGELLPGPRRSGAGRRDRVEESLRQLRARYGRALVGHLVPLEPDSRLPERQWALEELGGPDAGP